MAAPRYQDYLKASKQALQLESGLILWYGSSDYLLSRSSEAWRQHMRCPVDTSDAKDLNEAGFFNLFESASLFDDKTGVLLRRCEQQGSLAKWLGGLKVVDKPASLVFAKDRIPAPLGKELQRLGALQVPCFDPKPHEVPSLIPGFCRKHRLKLSREALDLLAEALGTDLCRIDQELEKLAMGFAGQEERELSADDIAPFIGVLRQDQAFALDKLLLDRQFAKAHVLLQDLLNRGDAPLMVLGVLARHVRLALRVSLEVGKGRPASDLPRAVGAPSWLVRGYVPYVGKVSRRKLERALELCREADLLLKSSRIGADLTLARILEALSPA